MSVAAWLAVVYLWPPIWCCRGSWTRGLYDNQTLDIGMITHTPQGIPGDPINVGLVGTKKELVHAFAVAGWDTGRRA